MVVLLCFVECLKGSEFLTDEELLLFYAEEWLKYADNVSYLERLFPSFNRQLSRINLDSDSGRTRYYHVYAVCSFLFRLLPMFL